MSSFSSVVGGSQPGNSSKFSSVISPQASPQPSIQGYPAESIVSAPISQPRQSIPVLSGIGQFFSNIGTAAHDVVSQPQGDIHNFFNDAKNSVIKAWQDYNTQASETTQTFKNPSSTGAQKIGSELQTVGASANLVFSPISAIFAGANDVPLVRKVTNLAAAASAVLGEGGRTISNDIIDTIPVGAKIGGLTVTQEMKDQLKPGIGDIVSLAAQLIGFHKAGEIAEIPKAKVLDIVRKYSPQDAQTIIKEAKNIAEEAKSSPDSIYHGTNATTDVLANEGFKQINYKDIGNATWFNDNKTVANSYRSGKENVSDLITLAKNDLNIKDFTSEDAVQSYLKKSGEKTVVDALTKDGFDGFSQPGKEGGTDYAITNKSRLDQLVKDQYGAKTAQDITQPVQQSLFDLRNTEDPNDAILNPLIDQVGAIIKSNGSEESPLKANKIPGNEITKESPTQRKTSPVTKSTNEPINKTSQSGVSKGSETGTNNERPTRSQSEGTKSTNTQRSNQPTDERNQARLKVSKISKEIDAKSVEKKLTQGFSELAGYDPKTFKEQAKLTTDLINKDIDRARAIIRGEEPLPKEINASYMIKAMEDYIEKNPDLEALKELVKSPLITETSGAAQTLSFARARDPYSPLSIIMDLENDKRAVIEKKTGKTVEAAIKDEVTKIDKEIKKTTADKSSWASFIKEIQC